MIVSRFAPSPTGLLHLGHAFSALLAYNFAKQNNGIFKLRIENIDLLRCKEIYEEKIYEDLSWLGIKWDKEIIRQSERTLAHQNYVKLLNDKELVYGCDCTRSDIENALSAISIPKNLINKNVYPGTCKEKKLSIRNNNVRINIEKTKHYLGNIILSFKENGFGPNGETGMQYFDLEWLQQKFGDFIISRKDIKTSYHLAVTIDDNYQNISFISRGNDLFYATPIHILLQKLFKFNTPDFFHHKLINDINGKKLSKSKKSESLDKLRSTGIDLKGIKSILNI
tara:strand:+ start:244 stop:1089 length:846 start_codon:yes stop_codon:yes gene_type:complete